MQTRFKKGFTLLELIIAMAIIAVLMGLSLFGIQSVQRSQRDTERRAALSNINLEVAAYYGDNGRYPDVTISASTKEARIGTGNNAKVVELTGAATPITGAESTQSGTAYCYETEEGSTYRLGVWLEGTGSWGNLGTAQQLGNDSAGPCAQNTVTN
ncbi:hypothetical protein DOJK_01820 [Patescibacteria group bacterium]|nr:hypothetical protein DOJK_01820 [Patescibacteria group bacterium]